MFCKLEHRGWKKVSASFLDGEESVHVGELNKPDAPPRTKSSKRTGKPQPLAAFAFFT
jgi:hypothetical protein